MDNIASASTEIRSWHESLIVLKPETVVGKGIQVILERERGGVSQLLLLPDLDFNH